MTRKFAINWCELTETTSREASVDSGREGADAGSAGSAGRVSSFLNILLFTISLLLCFKLNG